MPSVTSGGPVEVVEMIVHYLHSDVSTASVDYYPSDKQDLHSCTLVSRTWRLASQPYLFRDMVYSFQTRAENDDIRTVPMLCSFLQEHADIAFWIRRLKLQQRLSESEQIGPQDSLDIYSLGRLLSLLSRLHEIHLVDLVVTPSPDHTFSEAMKRPSVGQLHISSLSYFENEDKPDLRAILRCFGKVGKLTLSSIPWFQVPDLTKNDPYPPAIDPPVVQELELHGADHYAKVALSTLSKSLDITNVRALTIFSDCWHIYGEFIELLSPSLERICFPPVSWFDWLKHSRNGDAIAHCVKLRELTLCLSLISNDDSEEAEGDFDELRRTLSQALLTSIHPDLEKVVLLIDAYTLHKDMENTGIDMNALTKNLDSTLVQVVHHTGIRKIGFKWWSFSRFTQDEHEDCMRRLFPVLQENGMMEFLGIHNTD